MAKTNGITGEYVRIVDGHLEVRLKVGPGVPSSTGKSLVVASTGGFKPVDGSDVRVNLTAIRKG